MTIIGISSLSLTKRLVRVRVYKYKVVLRDTLEFEDLEPIIETRRAARNVASKNDWIPVTDIGPYEIGSLRPIEANKPGLYGTAFSLVSDGESELDSSNDHGREAIRRLVNQDVGQAAYDLARKLKKSESGLSVKVMRSPAGWTEIQDIMPSDRISAKSNYLDVYKKVRLCPQVLPSGDVMVDIDLKHSLCARNGITLDWVLRKRPEWFPHIKKVRHRYSDNGMAPLTVELKGQSPDKTAHTLIPGLNISLLDYHRNKGRLRNDELDVVQRSSIVTVDYGRGKTDHIAALLEPMFDFETLMKIDSPFLNRVAKDLKWPMKDRIQASGQMIKGLRLPFFEAELTKLDLGDDCASNIRPTFKLKFSDGRMGSSERDVLKLKAYKGMTINDVVCIGVGVDINEGRLRAHFTEVKKICDGLSHNGKAVWRGLSNPQIIRDVSELSDRLSRSELDSTMLVIAIDGETNKQKIRDVAFNRNLPCQFMRTDHPERIYQKTYYANLAAGVFSKGGGVICAIDSMPGDVELFIGLDMGGSTQRAPGTAFVFTRDGAQLGWQIADMQRGERMEDAVLDMLIRKSVDEFSACYGRFPKSITVHRDGRFYESLEVIKGIEKELGASINVLEVIKSGAPALFRTSGVGNNRKIVNPQVGDSFRLKGLDEMVLATYGGDELGKWGQHVSVRPLRIRKRYGASSLDELAQQVILLSRIHGASLYRHPRLPITTHHADRFATLRQECNVDSLSKMSRTCPVYL